MLRTEPLAYLPALLALALSALPLPASAEAKLISLCGGGTLPNPGAPGSDCDQACHSGCTRGRKASSRF